LVAEGLAANDRIKIRLSLLQAAARHARDPKAVRYNAKRRQLDDRLSKPFGVRAKSWLRLTACHPDRVQASSAEDLLSTRNGLN